MTAVTEAITLGWILEMSSVRYLLSPAIFEAKSRKVSPICIKSGTSVETLSSGALALVAVAVVVAGAVVLLAFSVVAEVVVIAGAAAGADAGALAIEEGRAGGTGGALEEDEEEAAAAAADAELEEEVEDAARCDEPSWAAGAAAVGSRVCITDSLSRAVEIGRARV